MRDMGIRDDLQQALRDRGYVSMAAFSYAIKSADVLKDLIADILCRAEQIGIPMGITLHNVAISPLAASLRMMWDEAWQKVCANTQAEAQPASATSWSEIMPPKLTAAPIRQMKEIQAGGFTQADSMGSDFER